jgi:prefoldin subunit 5
MDKEKIKARIEELRKQNDQGNTTLQEISQRREQIIQFLLTNNGRIMELEELLKTE